MLLSINLQPDIFKAVIDLGYSEWTEIQKKTIPLVQEGRDVIGQSYTGSGKTAAFGLPLLEKVKLGEGLQVLVVVPTRELCEQVTTEMRKFAKHKKTNIIAVYGGVGIEGQIHRLRTADVVVGTPGRLLDHTKRNTIKFGRVKTLVLDEADKMFEMGFIDDVKLIISNLPKERQTLLFSATISSEVHDIVKHYMKNPEKIKVQSYVDKGKMVQHYYSIQGRDKFSLLVHLLKTESPGLTIIFCATRRMVDGLSRNLFKQGIKAQALHGGLTQNRRKEALDSFHNKVSLVLVASDVAARGLDIKNVSHVINYDVPKSSQDYIHRIGRTARAGNEGKVISLISEQDHDNFRKVLEDRSLVIERLTVPEFPKLMFQRTSDRGRYGGFKGHSNSPRFGGRSHNSGFRSGQSAEGRRSHSSGGFRSSERSSTGDNRRSFGERKRYNA